MLDINLIRENPDVIRKDLEKRKDTEKIKLLDEVIKYDKEWCQLTYSLQELRHRRNVLTDEINKLQKEKKDFSEKIKEVKELPNRIKEAEKKVDGLKEKISFIMMRLPNILHDSVPYGADEDENQVVREFNKKPEFSFKPKSHVDIAQDLDLIDVERAAKISGARFYFLKNELLLLELALKRYAIDFLFERGYQPIEPPFMMRKKPYEGVTDLNDFEDVMYKIEGEDLYLIATSEHPLVGMYMDETFDEKDLPVKLAGISTNFRKEAGSHGKDTKGIFRVHQFNKIEQIMICKKEDSWKFHEELLKNAEELFTNLGLPGRITNICTGDIGIVAAKKFDIDIWMPVQEKYREVVSCSNCTDYQARRLNIKYTDGKEKHVAHTLNSTAIATGRALVGILENNQTKDGDVKIPEVLLPYMSGIKVIKKKE